jgi:hypothetical protein
MKRPKPGEIGIVKDRDGNVGKDIISVFIRSDTVLNLTGTMGAGERVLVLDEMKDGQQTYVKVLAKGKTWWMHSSFLDADVEQLT